MKKKVTGLTDVVTSDLRALLFWATVGVRNSRGGSGEKEIGNIIESYAETARFKMDVPPVFGADRPKSPKK